MPVVLWLFPGVGTKGHTMRTVLSPHIFSVIQAQQKDTQQWVGNKGKGQPFSPSSVSQNFQK